MLRSSTPSLLHLILFSSCSLASLEGYLYVVLLFWLVQICSSYALFLFFLSWLKWLILCGIHTSDVDICMSLVVSFFQFARGCRVFCLLAFCSRCLFVYGAAVSFLIILPWISFEQFLYMIYFTPDYFWRNICGDIYGNICEYAIAFEGLYVTPKGYDTLSQTLQIIASH